MYLGKEYTEEQINKMDCNDVNTLLTLRAPRVLGTHTKHQGGGRKGPPSISRTRNATNLKPLEGLGVSLKVSKNFKLV